MKLIRSLFRVVFFAIALELLTGSLRPLACAAGEAHFDHSHFDQFLKKYVNAAGEVDFSAAKADPELLNQYLSELKSAAAGTDMKLWDMTKVWPREEQLAFWLNAYHAAVISQVIKKYPLRSINDIEGVWTGPAIEVGPVPFSLNTIRLEQLLKAFHDEKIDMALACGARSCPPFPREAFNALRVEGQLYLAANQRIQDERFVRVDSKKKKIFLSKIFQWYENDFVLDFGTAISDSLKFSPSQMAVLSFVRHYLQNAEQIDYIETLDYKIKYLPFDWSLPDWHR